MKRTILFFAFLISCTFKTNQKNDYHIIMQTCLDSKEFSEELNYSYKHSSMRIIDNEHIRRNENLIWKQKPVLYIDSSDLKSYHNIDSLMQLKKFPPLEISISSLKIYNLSARVGFYFRNNGGTADFFLSKKNGEWAVDSVKKGFN